jgi:thymidylate synthase
MRTRGTQTYDNLATCYPQLFEFIRDKGHEVDSRIGRTKEVLNLQLSLWDPTNSLIGRPGMSDEFAKEELRQLISGRYNKERLAAIVPLAAELITEDTAYGPRIRMQLPYVERELQDNPLSRRAVIYIGKSDDLGGTKIATIDAARAGEMPCTCVWQFHLRSDTLYMSVYMRSWDMVWGLSYDVPTFTGIQRLLAQVLNVRVGTYTHNAGSAHIYEKHWDLEPWARDNGVLDMSEYEDCLSIYEARVRAIHLGNEGVEESAYTEVRK